MSQAYEKPEAYEKFLEIRRDRRAKKRRRRRQRLVLMLAGLMIGATIWTVATVLIAVRLVGPAAAPTVQVRPHDDVGREPMPAASAPTSAAPSATDTAAVESRPAARSRAVEESRPAPPQAAAPIPIPPAEEKAKGAARASSAPPRRAGPEATADWMVRSLGRERADERASAAAAFYEGRGADADYWRAVLARIRTSTAR